MPSLPLASDHAGLPLKLALKEALEAEGHTIHDLGTHGPESVDYPDFAAKVAEAVASGQAPFGILVCGSGIGMSIVANRFPGVRAALCHSEEAARLARRHNDANVLALGARMIDAETALRIVAVFLATTFEGGRHQLRLDYLRDHVEKHAT